MSSIRDKAISMLGQGVAQHLVAEAVGVTPSYISQLVKEPGVISEIGAIRAEFVQEDLQHDRLINKLEMEALKRIEKTLPYVKAEAAAKIFSTLNSSKRHAILSENDNHVTTAVTIVIPTAAEHFIKKNNENQVIEIDGKTIAPLPSRVLPQLATELAQRKQQQLPAPEAPHVVNYQEKAKARDLSAAEALHSASQDFTTLLNGVEVVI